MLQRRVGALWRSPNGHSHETWALNAAFDGPSTVVLWSPRCNVESLAALGQECEPLMGDRRHGATSGGSE